MFKRLVKPLAAALPFVLGLLGFWWSGESLINAAFNTVTMYFLNYGDAAPNLLVEFARWSAPLVTASGFLMLATTFFRQVRNHFRTLRRNSVAIYGDDDDAEKLKEQFGSRVIVPNGDKLVKADNYILFMDDNENLRFYAKHRAALQDKSVCIRSNSVNMQLITGDHITVYNPAEIAAQSFWKHIEAYDIFVQKSHTLRVSIIGFGKLGQELLIRALQQNIFALDQQIEYHVFGDSHTFKLMYKHLDAISDQIFFIDDWMTETDVIESSDIVVVAEEESQFELLEKLLFVTRKVPLHVLTADRDVLDLMENNDRVICFDWKKDVLNEENLFRDNLIRLAKQINLRYAILYGGAEDNEASLNAEWRKLNAFTKNSNISAADYHEMRLAILKKQGLSTNPDSFTPEQMETLAELEHIRWERYHFLSNWCFGKPGNGKAKDAVMRIHSCLIPYTQLREQEREKDRENIRVLMSVK